MQKEFIEFTQIKSKIQNSAELISELNKFEKVIILTRGGLVVAGILSQFLKTRWYDTACVVSYTEDKTQEKLKILKINPTEEKVLIIDDIVDTGASIIAMKKFFPNSKVFCLHFKPNNSKYIPDYYLWETDNWIVYPWELD